MRSIAFALTFVVALAACDSTPPERPPEEQTRWLGFRFAHNDTEAIGDTETVESVPAGVVRVFDISVQIDNGVYRNQDGTRLLPVNVSEFIFVSNP